MKKKSISLICCLLPSMVFAGDMGPENPSAWSKVTTLNLGLAYVDPGETQNIYLQPDVSKTYTSNFNSAIVFSGELFFGRQKSINDNLYGELGLAIAASSPTKVNGEVWEDGDQAFNNFTYGYYIQHEHLAIRGKLLPHTDMFIFPYINASIGVGFNTAHRFKISPIIIQELPTGPFSSNTDVAFTYTLGVGVQKSLDNHWQVGLGYEFADWGQSSLGRLPEQTINHGPALNHLYTNQLLLSLTYLAGE